MKEFEIIKINERGARQKRILGIDQFKIYNKPFKISIFVKFFFCNENREFYLLFLKKIFLLKNLLETLPSKIQKD